MLELTVQVISIGGPRHSPLIALRWKVDHQSVLEYQIYRGTKANDVTTLIGTVPFVAGTTTYTFSDQDVKLGLSFKEYYYIIRAILINGNVREETEAKSWFTLYRREEISILQQQDYYFREQAGHPFFLFSRKTLGDTYCPICWDEGEGKAKPPREGCNLCYNTGILNPFYPSEVIWAAEGPASKLQDAQELGRIDRTHAQLTMNGVPHVAPGDCLMDHTTRRFFSVEKVQGVGHHNRPVLQQMDIKEIVESDPIYRWLSI